MHGLLVIMVCGGGNWGGHHNWGYGDKARVDNNILSCCRGEASLVAVQSLNNKENNRGGYQWKKELMPNKDDKMMLDGEKYTNHAGTYTGGNQPHTNLPPYFTLAFIMKVGINAKIAQSNVVESFEDESIPLTDAMKKEIANERAALLKIDEENKNKDKAEANIALNSRKKSLEDVKNITNKGLQKWYTIKNKKDWPGNNIGDFRNMFNQLNRLKEI